MQSIPAAMTWEVLKRNSWGAVLAMLSAFAFPALIIAALRSDGLVDSSDPSILMMQIILLQTGTFSLGAAIYGAQGKISRLYAYPARTSELVTWRLLPAMVLIALQLSLCIGLLNLVFGLHWPIWGPALFASVSLAAVMAVAWLTDKSVPWMVVGLTIVGGALGLWFRSRFGGISSNPTHTWQQVTPGESLTMLAIAAASYWVAVFAVSRNRRGESPLSIGLLAWIERTFERFSVSNARLNTPLQAQSWIQWQRKGWAMPTSAFVLIIFSTIVWFFSSRSLEDLFETFFIGGYMLCWLGFIGGLLIGNIGPNDSNYVMGHFFATRPMSDSDMARAVLRTAFKSVGLTWLIWATAFAIACAFIFLSGMTGSIKHPDGLSWWGLVPATILGPWIVTGVMMSLLLVGRSNYLVRLACILPAVIVTIAVIAKFLPTREIGLILDRALFAATATGIVAISMWAYFAAHLHRLIQGTTACAAATIWIALTVGLSLKWPDSLTPHWFGYLLVAAAAALVVAPIATVPLAISWNRHR